MNKLKQISKQKFEKFLSRASLTCPKKRRNMNEVCIMLGKWK